MHSEENSEVEQSAIALIRRVTTDIQVCVPFALPTGNLNGSYLRPSHAVTDGAVQGQVPGFRNPPAGTRAKAIRGSVAVRIWALLDQRHPDTQVISRKGPVPLNRSLGLDQPTHYLKRDSFP
jgi:hypothetical protein